MKKVPDYPNVNFPVLVPNMKYFERAVRTWDNAPCVALQLATRNPDFAMQSCICVAKEGVHACMHAPCCARNVMCYRLVGLDARDVYCELCLSQ